MYCFETHKENINTDGCNKSLLKRLTRSSTSGDAVQYASNHREQKVSWIFPESNTTSLNAPQASTRPTMIKVLIGGMAINLK
jgi:hypothetical protein